MDRPTILIHSVVTTAEIVHDSQLLPKLLQGQETRGWGHSTYRGQPEVIRHHAPWSRVSSRPAPIGIGRCLKRSGPGTGRSRKIWTKIEYAFFVSKRIFDWAKVSYHGMAKDTHWFQISCGLVNLYVAWRRLLAETLSTCV